MNLYEETKFIMKKNNIIANKKLGQNFLINEDVVDSIIKSADIKRNRFCNRNRSRFRYVNEKIIGKRWKGSMHRIRYKNGKYIK